MKKLSISLITVLIALNIPYTAFGGAQPLRFTSIRQMGMGGAGTAITYDEHALYKNPAGLARADLRVKLPTLRMQLNETLINQQTALEEIMDDTLTTQERMTKTKNLIPLNLGLNIAASPLLAYTMPGFAIGGFANLFVNGGIYNRILPRTELSGYYDLAPMIGYARDVTIMDQDVTLGVSAYYLQRGTMYDAKTGDKTFSFTMEDFFDEKEISPDFTNTSGLGVNVGMLTSTELPMGKGHFGLTVHDIVSNIEETMTVNDIEQTEKTRIPTTLTMGLGFNTALPENDIPGLKNVSSFIGDFSAAIDYDLFSTENSIFKRLNMGAEKTILNDRVALRVGLHQGYFVCGIGLDLFIIRLNYASYTEELGQEIGSNPMTYHVVDVNLFL